MINDYYLICNIKHDLINYTSMSIEEIADYHHVSVEDVQIIAKEVRNPNQSI
jgi:hypothetical protein